jgi:hypothetical protein
MLRQDLSFSFEDLLFFKDILLFYSCPAVLDSTNPSFLPISFALYCKGPGATGNLQLTFS